MQLKLQSIGIYSALFLLLALSFMGFGSQVVLSLDPSWMMTLAHTFKHNWQAGVDYVFTYGPLGYFFATYSTYYDPVTFNYYIIWRLVMSCILAAIFLIRLLQLNSYIEKFVYFIALIIIASNFGDAGYILSIIAITLLILNPSNFFNQNLYRYFGLITATLICLAALSLMKFSYSFMVAISLCSILIHVGYKYNYSTALGFALVFIGALLSWWILLNQSLFNIPSFVFNSLQIASDYDAMSIESNPIKEYYFAFAGILLIIIMTWLAYLSKPYTLSNILSSVTILSGVFLAWKAGFVRHDGHVLIFFSVITLLPFLIQRPFNFKPLANISFNGLLLLIPLIGATGIFQFTQQFDYTVKNFLGTWNTRVVNNFMQLISLNVVKHQHDMVKSQLKRKHNLPRVKDNVKQATIDIFPPDQGIAFLNELNYHPRPVFQSYNAYNEHLLNLNAKFYANNNAPEFVLFKLAPIDNRFPLMEDSQVLKILARDYRPLLTEKGYTLLQRDPRGSGLVINTTQPLLQKTITFDETVNIQDLSSKNLTLKLNIQSSLLGKATKFLLKAPEVVLNMTTVNNKPLRYRIIPSMVNTDFMFNPLVRNENEWKNWSEKKYLPRIANFNISLKPLFGFNSKQLQVLFKPEIMVEVKENNITPQMSKQAILYSSFSAVPHTVVSPTPPAINIISENDKEVITIQAPSEMRFHITPGRHAFSCKFGVLKKAYSGTNPTDGIEFSASLTTKDSKQESLIFKRFLNPVQVEDDKNVQKWVSVFTMRIPYTLVLRTNPGPANDNAHDYGFWQSVTID